MSKRVVNILLIILVVLLFGASGYYRDVYFRHLNAQISVAEFGSPQFAFQFGLDYMMDFSLEELKALKWKATIFFFILHFLFSLLVLRIWFHERMNYLLISGVYLVVFILSGIGIFIGKMAPAFGEQGYYFARWLMGAGQSPLLLMLLVILLIGNKQKEKSA